MKIWRRVQCQQCVNNVSDVNKVKQSGIPPSRNPECLRQRVSGQNSQTKCGQVQTLPLR